MDNDLSRSEVLERFFRGKRSVSYAYIYADVEEALCNFLCRMNHLECMVNLIHTNISIFVLIHQLKCDDKCI